MGFRPLWLVIAFGLLTDANNLVVHCLGTSLFGHASYLAITLRDENEIPEVFEKLKQRT